MFRRHERMDPITELRHGPVVPKIPISDRQYIKESDLRARLEVYAGIGRPNNHTGEWVEASKTLTVSQFHRFRNSLKEANHRVLSSFLAAFNERGNAIYTMK